MQRSNGQNRMEKCLLLACCLLACWLDLRGEGCSNIYPLIYTHLCNSRWVHHTGSKVRAKGTTLYIHVAKGAKIGQNPLKMGSKHLFVHAQWSMVSFGKPHF